MKLAREQSGTASVEIVVMLPLFVLLFAGVVYLHAVGTAAVNAHESARGCAWQYAVAGCPRSAQGAGLCKGVTAGRSEQIAHDPKAAEQAEMRTLSDEIGDIPVIGALWESIFGEGALAIAEHAAPRLLDEGEQRLSTSYYMVCNTVSKSWDQVRREQLCAFAGKLNIPSWLVGCK